MPSYEASLIFVVSGLVKQRGARSCCTSTEKSSHSEWLSLSTVLFIQRKTLLSSNRMKLLIAIPALNEEASIEAIIERSLAARDEIIARSPITSVDITVV